MWWRFVFDKDGAIRDISLVEAAYNNSLTVIYVDAPSKAEAVPEAKRRYVNEYRKAERAERKANNQCKNCIRKLTSSDLELGAVHCAVCREANREQTRARNALKVAYGLTTKDTLPKELRRKKFAAAGSAPPVGGNYGAQTKVRRYRILSEVREAMRRRTKAELLRWLDDEIAACAPADAASPRLRLVK